jgi:hypothetical protein
MGYPKMLISLNRTLMEGNKLSEIQSLLENTMEGSGKFKAFSLKMIRKLTEGEKLLLTGYLASIHVPIPCALVPISYLVNMKEKGYTRQEVQDGILYMMVA